MSLVHHHWTGITLMNNPRKIWLVATLCAMPWFVHADPLQPFAACKQLHEPNARLQCFDKAAQALPAPSVALAAPSNPMSNKSPLTTAPITNTPATIAPENAVTREAAQDDFGRAITRPSDDIDALQATITELKTNNLNKLIITLDNQQTWRQTDTDRLKLAVGDQVIIKKASLGSFWLLRLDSNRKIKVKRVE